MSTVPNPKDRRSPPYERGERAERTSSRGLLLAVLLVGLSAVPAFAEEIRVTSQVLAPDARPQAGVRVTLLPVLSRLAQARRELRGEPAPEPVARAETDDQGFFRLVAPESGMWTVRAEAPGFLPMEIALTPLVRETALPPLVLERDARPSAPGLVVEERTLRRHGRLDLSRGSMLVVEIRDSRGALATGALIRAVEGAWPLGETAEDGRATIHAELGLEVEILAEGGLGRATTRRRGCCRSTSRSSNRAVAASAWPADAHFAGGGGGASSQSVLASCAGTPGSRASRIASSVRTPASPPSSSGTASVRSTAVR